MTLKQAATSGIRWSFIAQVSRQLVQILTTIVLARILSPNDFGLIGMTAVVIGFINLFKDLGTSTAIIQKQDYSDEFLSSIFWINVIFGCLVTSLIFLFSPLIANLYEEPRVIAILQFLSVTFFISSLSNLQQAILERDLAFNQLAKIEIFSLVLGSAVAIIVAILGAGVWSLVCQTLLVNICTTILLWVYTKWRPKLILQWKAVKSISHYSLHLTAANIFFYFVRNADNFLIGKFLGAEALGYYALAYRIMMYPMQNIGAVIRRVMFPVFSRWQEDNVRFQDAYLKAVALTSMITLPIVVSFIVLGKPLVLTLFGNSWLPTVPLLIILVPAGFIESIETTVTVIYQAKGRTDVMLYWGGFTGIMVVLAFVIGIQWGVIGVAVAYVSTLPLSVINFLIGFRLIHLSIRRFFSALWRVILCNSLMLCILLLLKNQFFVSIASYLELSILSLVGCVFYVFINWLINRVQVRQLISISGLSK
ncbi:MAG: MOP flippase family protein [Goleter apudmare HA4340-LM2]|jgi:PST family polysaccharide transporter|nr:MOP flippase family protein [Goleter apudmare HA4340-LM2]